MKNLAFLSAIVPLIYWAGQPATQAIEPTTTVLGVTEGCHPASQDSPLVTLLDQFNVQEEPPTVCDPETGQCFQACPRCGRRHVAASSGIRQGFTQSPGSGSYGSSYGRSYRSSGSYHRSYGSSGFYGTRTYRPWFRGTRTFHRPWFRGRFGWR